LVWWLPNVFCVVRLIETLFGDWSGSTFGDLRARLRSCDLVMRLAVKPSPLDRRALAHEIEGLLSKMMSTDR
jgi:hypothetical protein